MKIGTRTIRGRRARLVPLALTTAALSSAVLGASVTGTLSAFTATITNSTNTAGSSSLVMKETDSSGNTVCLSTDGNTTNTATCAGINKYGASNSFTPGVSNTPVVVKISNLGTEGVNAFALKPGTCSSGTANSGLAASSGDLCTKLKLTVSCVGASGSATPVVNNLALSAIAGQTYDIKAASSDCVPVTGGPAAVTFTFALTMDSGADGSVQNQTVSQPLTWTFTGA